jgi:hypothetical protein
MRGRVLSAALLLPFALAEGETNHLLGALGPVFASISVPEQTECVQGLVQALQDGVERLPGEAASVEAYCSPDLEPDFVTVGLAQDMAYVMGEGILDYGQCAESVFIQLFEKLLTDEATKSSICNPSAPSAASPFSFGVATTLALITVYMA